MRARHGSFARMPSSPTRRGCAAPRPRAGSTRCSS